MGGLTPEDRQRRLERWQQRQQEQLGQPADPQRNWQRRGEGRVRGESQGGVNRQGRGEGRVRPEMRQPQPGAARPSRPERPQRMERPPREMERSQPRSAPNLPPNSGLRPQDVHDN